MAEIKFDKRNYRIHNDRNKELINKSLKECGAGRSIVIDAEDEIIAGNGIYEQAQKLNIPTKIVETDGSELVVVKRTDLKTDDAKRKQLAVMDNSTSDSSEFNLQLMKEDFEIEQLNDYGIEIDNNIDIDIIQNDEFSLVKDLSDLRGLIYEPTGDKPNIKDLYSSIDMQAYRVKVLNSNMTEEEKDFCLKAVTRFYRFNFRNIAEYYCHSSEEVKEFFKELLLVIPDGKQLLRNKLINLDNIIKEEAENID